MISLLILIWIILLIVCLIHADYDDGWTIGAIILILAIIGFGAFDCKCITTLATAHTIDAKISMYEEENAKIEEKIENTVDMYMEYEQLTFEKVNNKNAMEMVSLFPELKADELIAKQISVYISNKNDIVDLRKEKLEDVPRAKFFVYFGK